MELARGSVHALSALGATVLTCVVLFLLLLPHYLGPNDLLQCEKVPSNSAVMSECHQADAVVAVSGGDTAARTREAIALYQNGWAPYLIFSGAAQDVSGPSNAEAMKRQAVQAGVPESAIITEETSLNTEQNATNTKALLQQYQLKKIILVTSVYHQRRANLEFTKRAGSSIVVVNHPVARDAQWTEQWYITPIGWWLVVGELVKIAGFYVSQ